MLRIIHTLEGEGRVVRAGVDLVMRARARRLLARKGPAFSRLFGPEDLQAARGDLALLFALKEAALKALGAGLFSAVSERLHLARRQGRLVVRSPVPAQGLVLGTRVTQDWVAAWALERAPSPGRFRVAVAVGDDACWELLDRRERRSCRGRLDPEASLRARTAAREAARAVGVDPHFRIVLDRRGAPHLVSGDSVPARARRAPGLLVSLAHDGALGAALVGGGRAS